MVLYYAVGGGMGHISKAKKVLTGLGITDFKIVTPSPFAEKVFESFQIIPIPASEYRSPSKIMPFLMGCIKKEQVSQCLIESFPFGLFGEVDLSEINKLCETLYVTRDVKWNVYQKHICPKGCFDATYLLEHINDDQMEFIRERTPSNMIKPLNLSITSIKYSQRVKFALKNDRENWIIVHTQPRYEVEALIDYAMRMAHKEKKQPHFLVCTTTKPVLKHVSFTLIDYFPASDFFPYVDRIISGAGFNTILEAKAYADKHCVFPFSRKYDDQWRRIQKIEHTLMAIERK